MIDVVDNGIGLPKANRSRLLEPYVTTREKGTGLGLAIVGRIIEEHGGSASSCATRRKKFPDNVAHGCGYGLLLRARPSSLESEKPRIASE